MSKIYFQGTFGAYSHLAALSIFKNVDIIPCKTFDAVSYTHLRAHET